MDGRGTLPARRPGPRKQIDDGADPGHDYYCQRPRGLGDDAKIVSEQDVEHCAQPEAQQRKRQNAEDNQVDRTEVRPRQEGQRGSQGQLLPLRSSRSDKFRPLTVDQYQPRPGRDRFPPGILRVECCLPGEGRSADKPPAASGLLMASGVSIHSYRVKYSSRPVSW